MRPFLIVLSSLLSLLFSSIFPAGAGILSAKDDQISRQAFGLAALGRYGEAQALAAGASDKLPAKILQWMAYAQPGNGASFGEITAFIAENPSWPYMRILQRQAEANIGPQVSDREQLDWFAAYPPLTTRGQMAYIQALLSSAETQKARDVIQTSWIESDMDAASEKQFLQRYGTYLTTQNHTARLSRLLWDKQYTAAARIYPQVGAGYQAMAEARIALNKKSKNAEALLEKVPASLKNDPGLIYERVRWRRQADMTTEAIELMLAHPKATETRPELWWGERSVLARRALQQGLISQAYRLAQAHGQKEGVGFAEAEWLAGWIALRFLQEPKNAYPHFVKLYQGVLTPASQARGAYWAGRAAEAAGDSRDADSWYRKAAEHSVTYHGLLALDKLNDGKNLTFPADPLPSSSDIKTFENHEMTRVVRILADQGMTEEARPFLLRLNDLAASPGQRALTATLATTIGRPDMAVHIARRAEREGIPLVSTGFPIPNLIYEAEPEKSLVLGLIRQESAFHTAAVSPAGARGLMQLMPDTAKRVAKKMEMSYTGPGQLTSDPGFNLQLGTAYLRTQLDDFSGSYIMALAAYNAGPNRVRRWVNDFGDPRNPGTDPIDWIEMIPFTETRNYVQKVLENVQIYRHRLGETSLNKSLEQDLSR